MPIGWFRAIPRSTRRRRGGGPFDIVFVGADKQSAADYLDCVPRLTAPGSLIVCDNVMRGGALADAGSDDPSVRGVRRLHDALAAEARVCATTGRREGLRRLHARARHRVMVTNAAGFRIR